MKTKNDLEAQVKELTQQLQAAQTKMQHFATILGQLRYRIIEVLDLEPDIRTKVVNEIDTVFNRAL